jgi:stearoyl-CoA desaturase (delta-9 desaturase)
MDEVGSLSKINWLNSSFLVLVPFFAAVGIIAHWLYLGPPGWGEFVIFIAMYFACGLSITVGYHRLFSHRSHDASWPLVLFYAIFGAGAFQNSVIEWSSDHRNHHRKTDSLEDPYSASRGFWYSHMGWVMIDEDIHSNDFANVKDLNASKILRWQHRNIFLIGALSGFALPALLGYLWGGLAVAVGCFVWGGLARTVFVHHGTFLINSAAHIWGTQPYSDDNSSRDSFWLAFLTFGEGYHNFHHTFQADYRNGHKWFHVDPSKWWINAFRLVHLKSNLKRTPKHSIEIAKIDTQFKRCKEMLAKENVDTTLFEKRHNQCRDALRTCMFEIHKAKEDLKVAMENSKEVIKVRISEMRVRLETLNRDMKAIFAEMNIGIVSMA